MSEESREPAPKSFGEMSEHHWSRARKGSNQEALEYYRERSKAPGVAEGGAARNFYCIKCDGVIPHDDALTVCPHCGAAIEPGVKRYFNWVEMDEPKQSDFRVLLPGILTALAVVAALVFVLVRWVF
jgi:hypothetical protein